MLDKLIKLAGRVKGGLGDLWWYTIIMFCVQRSADVINMFIGLWLVPRYVPQSELGAVLPLAQVGNVMGLPLMIVMGPFVKFLNTYATRGEYGKVKALLRDGCLLAVVILVGTLLYARLVMPPVFERMRVAEGRLGMLIVLSGAVSAATPIATTALQGLKMFRVLTYVGLFAAPLRLAVMAVCLPIRGLSGYFVGQTVPNMITMVLSFFGLRHILGPEVKAEPYLKQDGMRMLAYLVPCGMVAGLGILQTTVETFVIRHRLPDLQSAAYYMISRFAETGAYMGMTMNFVVFPLISERHEKGENSDRLLWHSMAGTLGIGLLLAGAFFVTGSWIFSWVEVWRQYTAFVPLMALLTLVHAFRLTTACFISHELACCQFRFLWYYSALLMSEAVVLYGLTGYGFFEPYVPSAWLTAVASFDPCRLTVVLGVMLIFTILPFGCVLAHMGHLSRRRRAIPPPKISVD